MTSLSICKNSMKIKTCQRFFLSCNGILNTASIKDDRLEQRMEVMFYIIAGKFNPSNDDFPVKTLITRDKFADKYAQDCTNLLDEQDIFKIIDKIEPAITNGIECVQPRKDVGFNGFVVEDVIGMGYWFWIDTDNTVCVTCRLDIEFDIFADENHKLTKELLLDMLHKAIEKAIAKSGLSSIVNDFEM